MEEQQEIWKPIIIWKNGILYDYTGLYEVSNMGRVRGLKYKKYSILKTSQSGNGYLRVSLCKDGKKNIFSIHRLVATVFVPNPNNLPVVNHRDECKSNNVWTNLEWCTQQDNVQYSSHKIKEAVKDKHVGNKNPMYGMSGGKSPTAKKVVCIETKQVFDCVKDAIEWCGGDISKCCKGKTKTAGKHPETGERLHWLYYDEWMEIQENNKKNAK